MRFLGLFLLIGALSPYLHQTVTSAYAKPLLRSVEGIVLKVSEGDELTVNANGTNIKVRLYGIDAPETQKFDPVHGGIKRGQAFGDAAFQVMTHKVLHQKVRLDILQHGHRDKEVCIVLLGNRDIGLEMLAEGWAWYDARHADRTGNAEYLEAEGDARARRLGLWVQDNPQPPWEFRKMLKRSRNQKK